MTFKQKRGWGVLKFLIYLRILLLTIGLSFIFPDEGLKGGGRKVGHFFVDVTNVQPLKPIFYYVIEVVF